MKQKLTLSLIILILLCSAIFSSCKKNAPIDKNENDISKAQQWYKEQAQSVKHFVYIKGKGLIPVKETPVWDKAKNTILKDGTSVVTVPLESNIFSAIGQKGNVQLVMENKNGNYRTRYIGDKKENIADKPVRELYRLAFANKDKLTPPLNSVAPNEPKKSKITDVNVTLSTTCTDWYWVTKAYEGGVLVSETWEYVGTTCDGSFGGGGGGGDGGGDPGDGNFGEDPGCLNCVVSADNFLPLKAFARAAGLVVSPSFTSTLTLADGSKHAGTVTEIRSPGGALVVSYFSPNVSSNVFTSGYYYSIGNKGPSGVNMPTSIITSPNGATWNVGSSIPDGGGTGQAIYTRSNDFQLFAELLGLSNTEILFLDNHIEILEVLNIYLQVNNKTQENVDFAKWTIEYLFANPGITIDAFQSQFMPSPELVANANADSWTDPDNVVLTDLDQTVYQQYQDSQPWPTVKREDIIPFEKFVPMRKNAAGINVNCLVLAKEQLGKAGYTCSGYLPNSQTFSIYTTQNGVDLAKTKTAISYMISSLSKKIPILIGVDNRPGAPSANKDNSTDHYVVIVGMGTDDNGKYFQFVDSATDNRSTGASYSNRLYYNSTTGKITGRTAIVGYRTQQDMHDYIVTQVRKSIKK